MSRARDTIDERVHAILSVVADDTGWIVSLDVEGDLPLGLRVHHGERDSFVRTVMRRTDGEVLQPGRVIRFGAGQPREANALAEAIGERLRRIARKPISQKTVERLLAISSAERTRWTKAGLLRQSGSAEIARGASRVTLPTYSPAFIEELVAEPATIAEWRASDSQQ